MSEAAADTVTAEAPWTTEDAAELYQIKRWGGGYFRVAENGHLVVAPVLEQGGAVDLPALVEEALARGLELPILVRFQDLLRHRVESLNQAFARAIAEYQYRSPYRGVFPIKVNQLREVVEEILDAGRPWHFGVEVGSKPEMYAGLAVHDDPESLIICNGYKDSAFVRTAMIGRKLGKTVILVVEKLSEIRTIIDVSREMNVDPMIGMRVRLRSEGAGRWATSGGENAKFGLSTAELIEAIRLLDEAGMRSAFKLLHFHIGSQVPNILTIKAAVREAARYYSKLRKMGCEIEYFDVGGGLGVDYDGSGTGGPSSINYSMQEYANDIVYSVMDVCDDENVPHPTLVSESGRAIVAPHSVLVVEAFGSIEKVAAPRPVRHPENKLVVRLLEIRDGLSTRNLSEPFHDLLQIRDDAEAMFGLGMLDLEVKAEVETLFWELAARIVALHKGRDYVPDEIRAFETQLADQYLCNFSVFQSLVDHWAVDQLFPIVPIHRLDHAPSRQGTLVDITCDSDGKVSKFIGLEEDHDTLPLHALDDTPYYLGVFMVGAYQDIMGDFHNLFGRVTEVHVFLDPDEESGYYVEEVIPGTSIAEVLELTQWDEKDLGKQVKMRVDAAIRSDRLKPNEGMRLLDEYEAGLKRRTYLDLRRV